MKKIFNTPFAVLFCMAVAVVFTACEPEKQIIDKDERNLAFVCDGETIADGSIYTSSKLDEAYAALGLTRFVPGIDLVGDANGKVTVIVQSLNEAMVEICAFGGCQMTLPYLDYTTSASGEITASTPLPLDIHYTPTGEGAHHAEALITAYYEGHEDKAVNFTLVMTNAKVE